MNDDLTPTLRKELDTLDYALLVSRLGPSEFTDTTYAMGQGYWAPGDGIPGVTFDGPADANAAGRCVANRVRHGTIPGISWGSIHPTKCGWCDYPKDVLLRALDHATWRSQLVLSEFAVWVFGSHRYRRSTGRSGEYDNPVWAEFFKGATPSGENMTDADKAYHQRLRADAIEAASGREAVPA